MLMGLAPVFAQAYRFEVREDIPLDSIRLSDPCILADETTSTYYMTGTGGMLWKSKDLSKWSGPYWVAKPDPESWMGQRPMIWAAELHKYNGKYYYFGTFWVDNDGKPYMIYCYEWLQNWNGTIEKIELKPDLSGSVGDSKVLFRAHDSPWSRELDDEGDTIPSRVTDGPWLFRTQTGKLGMLWTSWAFEDYIQGVAYSKSGTLDGPWVQEEEPISPPNFGHGMLFHTFEGKLLMSVHSHRDVHGHYVRIPHLFEVDDSGDKLVITGKYLDSVHQ